jgi:predicted amidohydrolase
MRQAGADLLVFPEYGAMELASLGGAEVPPIWNARCTKWRHRRDAVDRCIWTWRRGMGCISLAHPVRSSLPTAGARPVNRATLYGRGHHRSSGQADHDPLRARDLACRDPGTGLPVFDTPLGRIGILICYDSEFPLLARRLVEAGAEILLVPSCTDSLAGFTRVRVGAMARALENQCITVQAPTVGLAEWCPAVDENVGRAAIYGPPDRGFPPTGILAETELNAPGWAVAEVDLAAIHAVRRDGGVLNHLHWKEQADRLSRA